MIDLRSDTITRPTAAMRRAMADAEVGDDVFDDDVTVHKLQDRVSQLLGKEAGLFVPSGTMANQLAIKSHTQAGDEIICESGAHIFNYEAGGPAVLSAVQVFPIQGELGILSVDQISDAVRTENVHHPRTRLVCLENTHNRAGGTIYPVETIREIRAFCDAHGLLMHLDGARLWNAHVASGIPLSELAADFDSVSVCFSKGLGAPIGSLLLGNRDFITKAHRYRKLFGGGMRQVGIIAAGALYAVEHHIPRLLDDHCRIKKMAESLSQIEAIQVDLETVQTNILYFSVDHKMGSAVHISDKLKEAGVWMLPVGPQMIRAVAHLDICEKDMDTAIQVCQSVLQ